MAELTNEQLDYAVDAVQGKELRSGIRLAAPFLQLPWSEPNIEEFVSIFNYVTGIGETNVSRRCVLEFVRRRNAGLIPNRVDPRKEKIVSALDGLALQAERERMADLIIAALDAE